MPGASVQTAHPSKMDVPARPGKSTSPGVLIVSDPPCSPTEVLFCNLFAHLKRLFQALPCSLKVSVHSKLLETRAVCAESFSLLDRLGVLANLQDMVGHFLAGQLLVTRCREEPVSLLPKKRKTNPVRGCIMTAKTAQNCMMSLKQKTSYIPIH